VVDFAHAGSADDIAILAGLINPPALPYPPGLDQSGIDLSKTLLIETKDHAEILWSAEQALRSRACSAVICWPSKLTQQRCVGYNLLRKVETHWAFVFVMKPLYDSTAWQL
jgi:cell division inhibitor SulA